MRRPKMIIDATDDYVVVTGPRETMRRALDLPLCPYIEVDGWIRAEVYDPVPARGRQIANAAVAHLRRAR